MRPTVIRLVVVVATLGLAAGSASGQTLGFPADKAVQEINLSTKSVVCVSLVTKQLSTLQATVAALQAKVAALQAQLAAVLTSPNGPYFITVRDTGIQLAGPGVSLQLLDAGTAGSPVPTVEVATNRLQIDVAVDTVLTTGRNYLITTGGDMNMATGGDMNVATDGNTEMATGGTTSIETGVSTHVLSGVATTIQSGTATTIQGGPGTTPSTVLVGSTTSIHSVGNLDIESAANTTIESAGTLQLRSSTFHLP